MQTKLTLRLDDRLIAAAKQHARQQGKSLSALVADFFQSIGREGKEPVDPAAAPPVTRRLHGLLKSSGLDEADHKRHLEEKHR